MKNNIIKNLSLVLLLFVLCFSIISCGPSQEQTGYDGRSFDISANQNKQATVTLNKIGNDYKLTIKGFGNTVNYEKKESVPWNAVAKKIVEVEIEEGINNIGDYFFNSSNLTKFILPSTVTSFGEHSFPANAEIYTYAENIETASSNKIYYYSYNKPSEAGNYWHMVNDVIIIWQTYKVLFIGNSFTYYPTGTNNPGVPNAFRELSSSLGIDVNIEYVVIGSHTLTQYANPNDENGGEVVYEKLNKYDDYDFIILQEQSTTPVNGYNSFNKAVKTLVEKINATQKHCEVILYSTWGFPSGVSSSGNFTSVPVMEGLLTEAYEKCADELELRISYVGKAFTDVYLNHPEINLYYSDDKHQGYTGAYLSACVHVATLFNVDVTKAPYNSNLNGDVAAILREVAYKIVKNN